VKYNADNKDEDEDEIDDDEKLNEVL